MGIEDKCYDTEVGAAWARIWDFDHQIADEARVMATDQAEAELRYGCTPDVAGRGCYGGYREGERPQWDDTQGPGRFTVLFCMEPPDWAQAILASQDIHRKPAARDTYDTGWSVWPDFANHHGGRPGRRLAYDDLVDLWVNWPILDRRATPIDAVVPETFLASLAALAEIYHSTPPAQRPAAAELTNLVYRFLYRLDLEGVPRPIDDRPGNGHNALPADFAPDNPDFIYDLFIRGSE